MRRSAKVFIAYNPWLSLKPALLLELGSHPKPAQIAQV